MSYTYYLDGESYDGTIYGIRIRWNNQAISRLAELASFAPGLSLATLKALTENFVYLSAQRLGKTQAVIT